MSRIVRSFLALTLLLSPLLPATAAPGDPIGPVFALADESLSGRPAVARNALGSFVVAWTRPAGVSARLFAADGSPLTPVLDVGNTQSPRTQVDVAIDAQGNFVVVWDSLATHTARLGQVRAQRYDMVGQRRGLPLLVSAGLLARQPHVAMDAAGNFAITFVSDVSAEVPIAYNPRSGVGLGFLRLYSAGGLARSLPQAVDVAYANLSFDSAVEQVDVAMNASGEFVCAWMHARGLLPGNTDISVRRYSRLGLPLGLTRFAVPGEQEFANVAIDAAGSFVVSWQDTAGSGDDHRIRWRRYSAANQEIGGQMTLGDTPLPSNAYYHDLAMAPDGRFVFAWNIAPYPELMVQPFGSDATPLRPPYAAMPDIDLSQPVTAMDALGNFVVVWRGDKPYARLFSGS